MVEIIKNQYTYRINGKLYFDNFYEKEIVYDYLERKCYNKHNKNHPKELFYDCIINNLNKKSVEISKEIAYDISNKLYSKYEIKNLTVNIDLNFKVGSIAWSGIYEIIQVMANIGGAVAFAQIAKDSISYVISKYIKQELNFNNNHLINDDEIINNIHTDIVIVNQTNEILQDNKTNKKDLFPLDKILIAITLLNVFLFLGGTIYSGITIDSINQQYKESEKIIQESKEKYSEAKYNLQNIKNELENSKDKIDKLIIKELKDYNLNIHKKFEPLINKTKNDLNKYNDKIIKLSDETVLLNKNINSLKLLNKKSKDLYENSIKYGKEIELINDKLYSRKNSTINDFIVNVWTNGDNLTKTILIILFLYSITPIFITFKYIIKPAFKWLKSKL